jgi:hypothetical protein
MGIMTGPVTTLSYSIQWSNRVSQGAWWSFRRKRISGLVAFFLVPPPHRRRFGLGNNRTSGYWWFTCGKKMLGKAWHGGWAALSQVQILTGEFNIPGHQSYSNLAYASRKYSPKLLNGNRFGVRVLRTTCRELESNVSNRSISDITKCGLLCRSCYERNFSDNTDRDRNCKIIEPWW